MLAGVYIHPMFLALTGLSMSVYFPCAMDLVAEYFGHQMTKALPIVMNVISIHLLVTHYIVGQLNNLVVPLRNNVATNYSLGTCIYYFDIYF